MPFETLTLGLTLRIPTNGTRSWGTTLKNAAWAKISAHGHKGGGDGNQLVTDSYAANSITTEKLSKNIGRNQRAGMLAPGGMAQAVDWNDGNVQKLSLAAAAGDVTLTLQHPGTGASYTLFVVQGAAARDLIWPAAVKWANGQKPILSQANGAIDKIELYFDGVNYFGDWELGYA